MESMVTFISILFIVFGILQIILFFKLWGMTNDISEIKKLLNFNFSQKHIVSEDITNMDGWSSQVTNDEKIKAGLLLENLKPNQVIAYVHSRKKMEIWSCEFWEREKNNKNYKLIYRN